MRLPVSGYDTIIMNSGLLAAIFSTSESNTVWEGSYLTFSKTLPPSASKAWINTSSKPTP